MRNIILLTALLLLLPIAGTADTTNCSQQLKELKKATEQIHSITFNFEQETSSGNRVRQGEGKGVFIRNIPPDNTNIMRWDYLKPEVQTIINDGKKLSIYNQNEQQLLISSAEEVNQDITYALLMGNKDITKEFICSEISNRFSFSLPGTKLVSLKITPAEPHPQIASVQLWLDENHIIHYIVMEDHFGSVTKLTLHDIEVNSISANDSEKIAQIVKIDTPAGVEVIQQ